MSRILQYIDELQCTLNDCTNNPLNNEAPSHARLTAFYNTYNELIDVLDNDNDENILCLAQQIKNALTYILFRQSLSCFVSAKDDGLMNKHEVDLQKEGGHLVFYHQLIIDWLVDLYHDSEQLYFWRVLTDLRFSVNPLQAFYSQVFVIKVLIDRCQINVKEDWRRTPFNTEMQLFFIKHPELLSQVDLMINAILDTSATQTFKQFIVDYMETVASSCKPSVFSPFL